MQSRRSSRLEIVLECGPNGIFCDGIETNQLFVYPAMHRDGLGRFAATLETRTTRTTASWIAPTPATATFDGDTLDNPAYVGPLRS